MTKLPDNYVRTTLAMAVSVPATLEILRSRVKSCTTMQERSP
ncbi:hypothetical protein [Kamptonema sp. UHCC 0994]|nr:hypothetical protein [Kamptonema sp. UHCC 0994]MDF0551591.1 hypothetical protein [Kamptonema sp. UHCC 0994]